MILIAVYPVAGSTESLLISANPPFSSTSVYKDIGFTPSVILTVTGGSGSYTYDWVITDDGGGHIDSIVPDDAAIVKFAYVGMESGIVANGQATCTVTDTVSGDVATLNYFIQLLRF